MSIDWDIVASTGEWAGAVAVVVTLFYLAMQLRAQNRISRFNVWQTCQSEFNEFNRLFIEDPSRLDVYLRGMAHPEDLSDSEAALFQYLHRIPYNTMLAAYNGHRLGLVPDEDWAVWARWSAREYYQLPGGILFRELNASVTPDFFDDLKAYVPDGRYGDMTLGRQPVQDGSGP